MTPSAGDLSIVMVLPGLSSGGTERVASNLANYWHGQGNKVTIVIFSNSSIPFYKLSPGISIRALATESYLSNILGIKTIWIFCLPLRRLISKTEPNVVLSFLPQANIVSVLATLGIKVITIVSERNDISKKKIRRYWNILRKVSYRLSSTVTINLEDNRKYLEGFVPSEKIVYLPNPILVDCKLSSHKRKTRLIASVGRLHHQKGYDILIDAFFRSNAWKDGWKLEIAGEGPQKDMLLRLIDSYQLSGFVSVSSPTQYVWKKFRDAMIFAMPSRYEGTPNALLEALQLGMVPIVSLGVGGLADQIRAIDSNLVVPTDSYVDLAKTIKYATTEVAHLQFKGSQFKKLSDPYLLENAVTHWDKLINRLVCLNEHR